MFVQQVNIGNARNAHSFTFDSVYSSNEPGPEMDAKLFEKYIKGMVSGLLSGLNATVRVRLVRPYSASLYEDVIVKSSACFTP